MGTRQGGWTGIDLMKTLDGSSLSGMASSQGSFGHGQNGSVRLLDHCPSVPPRRSRHTFRTSWRPDLKKAANGRSKSADGRSVNRGRAAYRRYTLTAVATIPMERAGILELWSMPDKRFFPGMGIS